MDLQTEITNTLNTFIESGKLKEKVDQKVASLIDNVLSDIFSKYSDYSTQLKKAIEEKLDINLQRFDTIDYNGMIAKAINDNLAQHVNNNSVEPIMKLVQNSLGFIKKESIKLSEIYDMVIEAAIEDSCDSEHDGHVSFYVEKDSERNWYTVMIDVDENEKENCFCEIIINTGPCNNIFLFKAASNWHKNRSQVTPSRLAMLGKLEHQIFRLYSSQVKIEIDETEFDRYWSKEEY